MAKKRCTIKVLQLNTVANSGSTGRIAEEIGNVVLQQGHESYIAYGRGQPTSNSELIKIGSKADIYFHGAYTLLTDQHGWASKKATKAFLQQIDAIKPDLIALHNLHGYYLNLPLLFEWIRKRQKPVVWTLFDCWAFTGHCSYFDDIGCEKWKSKCFSCPKHKNYPSSWVDNSDKNFVKKRDLFTSINNLEIVTHSQWLCNLVKTSFLQDYPVNVTPSAINLDLFKATKSDLREQFGMGSKKIILGCASAWSNRKGYDDFRELYKLLPPDEFQVVMIGLNKKEREGLPEGIIGIARTESIKELAQWYSLADVFVNPTSQDNFPTTNLEALACGTPVVTYNTGGSPEAIDEKTGVVVTKGDVSGLFEATRQLVQQDRETLSKACRSRAEQLYDKKTRYLDYLDIFNRLLEV